MALATVSKKGWVVIPKILRKKYGIKPGGKVAFVEVAEGLYIAPVPDDPIAALEGVWRDRGPTTEDVIEMHRRDRELEEAKIRYWSEGDGKGQ